MNRRIDWPRDIVLPHLEALILGLFIDKMSGWKTFPALKKAAPLHDVGALLLPGNQRQRLQMTHFVTFQLIENNYELIRDRLCSKQFLVSRLVKNRS